MQGQYLPTCVISNTHRPAGVEIALIQLSISNINSQHPIKQLHSSSCFNNSLFCNKCMVANLECHEKKEHKYFEMKFYFTKQPYKYSVCKLSINCHIIFTKQIRDLGISNSLSDKCLLKKGTTASLPEDMLAYCHFKRKIRHNFDFITFVLTEIKINNKLF